MNPAALTVTLIGKPNVGKSTLFNVLTESRNAIVGEYEGLTHDRQFGTCNLLEQPFSVIDCGGITTNKNSQLDDKIQNQVRLAIASSQLLLFLVDCTQPLSLVDTHIVEQIRKTTVPIVLVANKIDGSNMHQNQANISELGFADPIFISATTKRGVKHLLQRIDAYLQPLQTTNSLPLQTTDKATTLKTVCIIGRPNVGKSTLINQIVKDERQVVSETAGTTRDAIAITYKNLTLVDTAGIRKKSRKKNQYEIFSVIKAKDNIKKSDIVILVLDIAEPLTTQDLHILKFAIDNGCSIILGLNKIDQYQRSEVDAVVKSLKYKLSFAEYIAVIPISALYNKGIKQLIKQVYQAKQVIQQVISTNQLNTILKSAIEQTPPPYAGRMQIKMRYAHRGSDKNRTIIIHGTNVDKVPLNYQKYLIRYFRTHLDLKHTPIQLEFRNSNNPYKNKTNQLTQRQKASRNRMLKFHGSKIKI